MKNKLINNIEESLLNSIKEGDNGYINYILVDDGFDLNNLDAAVDKNVKKLLFLCKAKANKANDDKLLEVAYKLREGIEKGLEKPISLIKELINKKEFNFEFRNLDKLSENDIKEIIKGHNLLSILEDLEDSNDEPNSIK